MRTRLTYPEPDESSTPSKPSSSRSILISSLRSVFQVVSFPRVTPPKPYIHISSPPTRPRPLVQRICLLDLIEAEDTLDLNMALLYGICVTQSKYGTHLVKDMPTFTVYFLHPYHAFFQLVTKHGIEFQKFSG